MAGTKKIPMRLCIGCGNMKPKKELMRVLKNQDDSFVLDTTGRKNGRGAYVCRSAECLDMAIRSRGLSVPLSAKFRRMYMIRFDKCMNRSRRMEWIGYYR